VTAWKQLEKKAAAKLGGERVIRERYEEAPDVEHELFGIECKWRRALPLWVRQAFAQADVAALGGKVPLVVLKERYQRGEYVILRLGDFVDLCGPLTGKANPQGEGSEEP
jgi:hypothetical protein